MIGSSLRMGEAEELVIDIGENLTGLERQICVARLFAIMTRPDDREFQRSYIARFLLKKAEVTRRECHQVNNIVESLDDAQRDSAAPCAVKSSLGLQNYFAISAMKRAGISKGNLERRKLILEAQSDLLNHLIDEIGGLDLAFQKAGDRNFQELECDTRASVYNACTLAEMALRIHQHHSSGDDQLPFTEGRLQSFVEKHNNGEKTVSRKKGSLRNKWIEYGPVAHLILALKFFQEQCANDCCLRSGEACEGCGFEIVENDFEEYLWVAEMFRRALSEVFFDSGQRLVSDSGVVRIAGIDWMDRAPQTPKLKRLSPDEIKTYRDYKVERRGHARSKKSPKGSSVPA